ncbi:MAG: ATP-dependent DNA helicase [Kiritimatiellia bacterium]|nr:ATP-dependent DNA helicase [Kiritimatiellia bacterium]
MAKRDIDPKKKEIIEHVDGPLLVIAGPGAGKTMAIVERVVNLIARHQVAPENILVSTFTEKAAAELVSRISDRMAEEGLKVSLNEMYIGTMHSIFLRVLKDYAEFTRLKKNYKTFDDFDQKYAVYRNLYKRFKPLSNLDLVAPEQSNWSKADLICRFVNKVREEAIDAETLLAGHEPEIVALGEVYRAYQQILVEENAIDFSAIQSEMLSLIDANPQVLKELQKKFTYLIIDEYQDTNTIQERILLKLCGKRANICVVGDEDQSIYRFRGASVRNILQFAANFPRGRCKTVVLDTNYRSHPDIVDFYNQWMTACDWKDGKKRFRFDKTIRPRTGKTFDACPTVVTLNGEDDEDWGDQLIDFIRRLQKEKVVTDLNQIAFLFHSVRNKDVIALTERLEASGIPVFSPRSARFFEREETQLLIGLFMLLFPQVFKILDEKEEYMPETVAYYRNAANRLAAKLKEDPQGTAELVKWAKRKAREHAFLGAPTDYTFLGLFYEALKFPLFADYIKTDHDGTPRHSREAFNLALFSQLLAKFEYIYGINVLSPKWLESNLSHLFTQFLHFMLKGGLEEFEDYDERVPSGCVSVMTIHQSKGLEFPVVCVGSLSRNPRKSFTALDATLESKYFHRPPFEPLDRIKFFDFWREYYVAFSRPQNLLILTGVQSKTRQFGKTFDEIVEDVMDWRDPRFVSKNLHLEKIKKSSVKKDYAFTSDILTYERCPTQYMVFRYLGFAEHRVQGTMFGSLVHQTIEDIHKTCLRGETVSEAQIESWFASNYTSLSLAMKTYLDETRRESALKQVKQYFERNSGAFGALVAAEYDVSIPTETYILRGVIDLVRGEGDTVEIIDFKTDKKPNVNSAEDRSRIQNYHRQLEVYAHIVEEKFGKKVSKLHLYYTRAENESPYVSWDYSTASVQKTLRGFDETVAKIESYKFSNKNVKMCKATCDNCDLRYFCHFK